MDTIIDNLRLHTMVLGTVSTNCYIISNTDINEAIIVDPADRADIIMEYIEKEQLILKGILLTHGHFDHILAAADISNQYRIPIYANKEEKTLIATSNLNLSLSRGLDYGIDVQEVLQDGQVFSLAGMTIKAIHTPGHTSGGNCYYIEDKKLLLSGDTLFRETVGRTDLPTGNYATIIHSLREKLMLLEDDTLVCPGHGEFTTIGYERDNNPYVKEEGMWD